MPDGPTETLAADAIRLGDAILSPDPSGALWWADRSTLIVADLHFEKGSAFAAAGQLIPPYDTRATLERLAVVVDRFRPARVVCLGDSFHDTAAEHRMSPADAARIAGLTAKCEWVWIVGNHDPTPPEDIGGRSVAELELDGVILRHCADQEESRPEISGHFHPKARVETKSRNISRACFVEDGRRLILPAFGAYTGGLNVLDPAIRELLGPAFKVHLIGRDRIYRFPSHGGGLIER